mmetsp:Transcript_21876/g.54079  ORF Transcript_21876/g.54079 Transcript_21876/m.54079 type:complete len:112 (-) Transcript_21876:1856-2191(-)
MSNQAKPRMNRTTSHRNRRRPKKSSWDAVLKVPEKSEEDKTPTIDEKLKSQKTARKKDDIGGGSLSKLLKKWRKAADNEEDDSEEGASSLDKRINHWKNAADRASTRHLGA